MNIEIGNKYRIAPVDKKSFTTFRRFEKSNGDWIELATTWRWGSAWVVPQDEEEVEWLTDSGELEINNFADFEIEDYSDDIMTQIIFPYGEENGQMRDEFRNLEDRIDDFPALAAKHGYDDIDEYAFVIEGDLNVEEA